MQQYLDLVRQIFEQGSWQENRTGVRTLSVPGLSMRFDLQQGFPAVTTKKLAFKSAVGEMGWPGLRHRPAGVATAGGAPSVPMAVQLGRYPATRASGFGSFLLELPHALPIVARRIPTQLLNTIQQDTRRTIIRSKQDAFAEARLG